MLKYLFANLLRLRLIFHIFYIVSFLLLTFIPNIFFVEHIVAITIILGILSVLYNKNKFNISLLLSIIIVFNIINVTIALYKGVHNFSQPFAGLQENTTMFSMYITLSFPALIYFHYQYKYNRLLYLCLSVFIVAIFISCSRTGIICICITLCYIIKIKTKNKYFITALLFISLCSSFIAFNNKKGSTNGRAFILNRTYDMIKKKPLGWGNYGFSNNYMKFQANYFKHNYSENTAYLADDIKHPLNEFLHITVNWGIPITFAIILFLIYLLHLTYNIKNNRGQTLFTFIALLCTWGCFSYPLTQPCVWLYTFIYTLAFFNEKIKNVISPHKLWFISLIIIAAFYTIIDLNYRYMWECAIKECKNGNKNRTLTLMENAEKYYKDNSNFLYSYATVLYNLMMYEETILILNKYKKNRTSYDAELLLGNSYMSINKYKEAEIAYINAFYMCPVRFIPLYNLFKIYKNNTDYNKMKIIGKYILSKKIKINSREIQIIKHNTYVELQKIQHYEL